MTTCREICGSPVEREKYKAMDFLKSHALNLEPILGEMRDRWNDYIFEPILRRKIEGILSLEGRGIQRFHPRF